MTIVSREVNGEVETIHAVFLDEDHGQIDDNRIGGTAVQGDGLVRLYGDVVRIYHLSRNITVHKFKRISFTFEVIEGGSINAEICIYEAYNSTDIGNACPSRCFSPDEGENVINIGGTAFDDRIAHVNYIGFIQKRGLSEVKGLQIYSDPESGTIDENDKCVDPNARRVKGMGDTGCYCMDGYVSSNGGKHRGIYDTCLGCLSTDASKGCSSDRTSGRNMTLNVESCIKVGALVL